MAQNVMIMKGKIACECPIILQSIKYYSDIENSSHTNNFSELYAELLERLQRVGHGKHPYINHQVSSSSHKSSAIRCQENNSTVTSVAQTFLNAICIKFFSNQARKCNLLLSQTHCKFSLLLMLLPTLIHPIIKENQIRAEKNTLDCFSLSMFSLGVY